MPFELLKYILQNIFKGVQREVIEAELIKSGWTKEQIDQGFVQAASQIEKNSKSTGYSKLQLILIFIAFALVSQFTIGFFVTVYIGGLFEIISSRNNPLFYFIDILIPLTFAVVAFYIFVKRKRKQNGFLVNVSQSNTNNKITSSTITVKHPLPIPVISVLGVGLGLLAGISYISFYNTQCSFNHNCPTGSEEGIGIYLAAIILPPIIFGLLFTIGAVFLRSAKLKLLGVLIIFLALIFTVGLFISSNLVKRQDPNTSIQNETANQTMAQGLWYPDNKGPYQKIGKGYDYIPTPGQDYCKGIVLHYASSNREIDIEEIDSQDIGAGCLDYAGFQPKDFSKIVNSGTDVREIDDLETGIAKSEKLKVYLVKSFGDVQDLYTKKGSTLLKITVKNDSCDSSCIGDLLDMVSHMYSYH